jgi:hypothetical protein
MKTRSHDLEKNLRQIILVFVLAALFHFLGMGEARAQEVAEEPAAAVGPAVNNAPATALPGALNPEIDVGAFLRTSLTDTVIRTLTGESIIGLLSDKFRLGLAAGVPQTCLRTDENNSAWGTVSPATGSPANQYPNQPFFETIKKCAEPLIVAENQALLANGTFAATYLDGLDLDDADTLASARWVELNFKKQRQILVNIFVRTISSGRMSVKDKDRFIDARLKVSQHEFFKSQSVRQVIDTMVLLTVVSDAFLTDGTLGITIQPDQQ